VAVPVCPPDPFHPVSDVSAKLASIIDNCQPSILLSSSEYTLAIEAAKAYNKGMKQTTHPPLSQPLPPSTSARGEKTVDLYSLNFRCIDQLPVSASTSTWSFPTSIHASNGLGLAFLQYTSGSTGQPKGVMVGHVNIVTNAVNCSLATRVQKSFVTYTTAVAVSWLPTFHVRHPAPLLHSDSQDSCNHLTHSLKLW
jgi:acyl-CoA synthetase (AMP-forming)/AMP-acid ligase II